jgi:hypothetical protein
LSGGRSGISGVGLLELMGVLVLEEGMVCFARVWEEFVVIFIAMR